MKSARQILKEAVKNKVAIGHFNIADLAGLQAIVLAVKELRVPAFIGTSEGEAKFLDRKAIAFYIKTLREEHKLPIFLNSDHTHSLEEVKKAVAAGYDAILFDGGTLPLEENIKQTKKVVSYVRSKNKNIIVEGELGNIGSGSTIRKELPKGLALSQPNGAAATIRLADLTKPEEALKFVKATGVDMLAPAVGNIHGMFANAPEPALNIKRIKEIKDALQQVQGKLIPLVLHGGSGNTDADFSAAIDAGINMIHISTELRLAWRKGMEKALMENPDEIAPYKLFPEAIDGVGKIVKQRLQLFNKLL